LISRKHRQRKTEAGQEKSVDIEETRSLKREEKIQRLFSHKTKE